MRITICGRMNSYWLEESLNNVADRFNRMIEMWQEADLLPLPDGVKVTAKQDV